MGKSLFNKYGIKYNYSKQNKCLCGKIIDNRAINCKKCAGEMHSKFMLSKDAPNYIDGRCSKQYYCIDCGKEIDTKIYLYGSKKCGSCSHKGKKLSKRQKIKIGESHKGKKHWNWQGGKTLLYDKIRNLVESKDWRRKIFKRDNYTCQECEQHGGDLEAHHIKPFAKLLQEFLSEYNQFSPIEDKETLVRLAMKWKPFWDIDNGKTLCKDCHNQE